MNEASLRNLTDDELLNAAYITQNTLTATPIEIEITRRFEALAEENKFIQQSVETLNGDIEDLKRQVEELTEERDELKVALETAEAEITFKDEVIKELEQTA